MALVKGGSSTAKRLYRVDAFPVGVVTGTIIYHNGFDDFFVCNNGADKGGDTTVKGNWLRGGKVEIDHMLSTGQIKGKILVTDGSNGYTYEDCEGGTLP